ncbi:hypothetical protein [Cryobacterium sp. Y82]|uniref:hypothetical protein n=1 Tax=Cryobacterium sp. Y82 TaxID=2045017 RepID=UPI0011B0E720|nr:hypothetical protein [Cryobacterium sp. Y82]
MRKSLTARQSGEGYAVIRIRWNRTAAPKRAWFRRTLRVRPGPPWHTAIGFDTDDIEAEVTVLRGLGVTFEDYDFPGLKTENGIATTSEDRAA